MALVTASDYQTALYRVLYYMDQNYSGIDKNGTWIFAKILKEDWDAIMVGYYAFKKNLLGTFGVNDQHIVNNAVAAGQEDLTFSTGGGSQIKTSPVTW